MDLKKIIIMFVPAFAIAFVICIGVTLLWSLVFHGDTIVDWETSFRFATVFGIILPVIYSGKRMRHGK
jgi:hypothetical protein